MKQEEFSDKSKIKHIFLKNEQIHLWVAEFKQETNNHSLKINEHDTSCSNLILFCLLHTLNIVICKVICN